MFRLCARNTGRFWNSTQYSPVIRYPDFAAVAVVGVTYENNSIRLLTMRAVRAPNADGVLVFEDVHDPEPEPTEILVRVTAAGVNRLDILQKFGRYPVPPGESDILGVEISGKVDKVGAGVLLPHFKLGDRVCALVGGGGYAQKVCVPARQLMPSPSSLSDAEACAIRMCSCY